MRSRTLLSQTMADLRSIASGLHPRARVDEGLAGAVSSLTALSPIRVETSIAVGKLDPAVESTAYERRLHPAAVGNLIWVDATHSTRP